MCKRFVTARYGAVIFNADVVNHEFGCENWRILGKKKCETGPFLSSKTTVKYNLRLLLNAGAEQFFAACFAVE